MNARIPILRYRKQQVTQFSRDSIELDLDPMKKIHIGKLLRQHAQRGQANSGPCSRKTVEIEIVIYLDSRTGRFVAYHGTRLETLPVR